MHLPYILVCIPETFTEKELGREVNLHPRAALHTTGARVLTPQGAPDPVLGLRFLFLRLELIWAKEGRDDKEILFYENSEDQRVTVIDSRLHSQAGAKPELEPKFPGF